jgi:mannose-6-phosphate isomerase-like protein (cupin superfamily)
MGKRSVLAALFLFLAPLAAAQEDGLYYELDPRPYNPSVDVNTDMFMADWHDSSPRLEYGALIIRDIFTRHDGEEPLKPRNRGAVLNVLTEYAHATLPSRSITSPAKLRGMQKIFYFLAGNGTVAAGGKTANVSAYVAVLIPEGLEFLIKNTGDSDLAMIVVGEPTYPGFQPRKDMLVRDENALPISGVTGHWVNINKQVFIKGDGLAAIIGFSPVWLDPITMAQPHASKGLGTDVLWLALEGDIYTLFGKKLYHLHPGMAFKNPSDGKVYHSNINTTDKQIKLLWVRSVAPENFPGK